MANILEVVNFASTFYVYIALSKDFRETFTNTVKLAKSKSVATSFFGSVSGMKDTIKVP